MTRPFLLSTLVAFFLALAGCSITMPPADTAPTAAPSPAHPRMTDIVGDWTYAVASPGGGDDGTFSITGGPGAYEGEILAQGEPYPLRLIALDGDTLSFQFQVGNGPVVRCTGVVEDGEFNGTAAAGQFGTFPMTATHSSRS